MGWNDDRPYQEDHAAREDSHRQSNPGTVTRYSGRVSLSGWLDRLPSVQAAQGSQVAPGDGVSSGTEAGGGGRKEAEDVEKERTAMNLERCPKCGDMSVRESVEVFDDGHEEIVMACINKRCGFTCRPEEWSDSEQVG